MEKKNLHLGSSFDDFLKHEGIFEEVQAVARKRALAESIEDDMNDLHALSI
jgi:antitoxin HicB